MNDIDEREQKLEPYNAKNYGASFQTPAFKAKVRYLDKMTAEIQKNVIKPTDSEFDSDKYSIKYKEILNESQFLAATTIKDPLLIIAGAGSGKTTTLTYRVAFMLENNIRPENILLLTFTRKAAKEMLERTAQLLGNVDMAKRIAGGTFHSFANAALRKYAIRIGMSPNFAIIDDEDCRSIISSMIKEESADFKGRISYKIVSDIAAKMINNNLSVKHCITEYYPDLENYVVDMETLQKKYHDYKINNSVFNFDDLLFMLADKLEHYDEFRKDLNVQYKYIMIDEYQDTNIIQKKIMQLLSQNQQNVMVVGDDSQSIYSFRGAEIENILLFKESYPNAKIIKIETNYRSTPQIINFTNDIVAQNHIGFKKELNSHKAGTDKPVVKRFSDASKESEFVSTCIETLIKDGTPMNDIAVLCRRGKGFEYLQLDLKQMKIPFKLYGGTSFLAKTHVKDVIAFLRVINNPKDYSAWQRVLRLVEGVGVVGVSQLIDNLQKNKGTLDPKSFAKKKWKEEVERLQATLAYIDEYESYNIAATIRAVMRYYDNYLLNEIVDPMVIAAIHKDIDILVSRTHSSPTLAAFINLFMIDPPSEDEKKNNQEQHVTLSTVHSAKGLEWAYVFVIELIDGKFPSAFAIKDQEGVEEERRLFYVACTRAKKGLFLTVPCLNKYSKNAWKEDKPSRFLLEANSKNFNIHIGDLNV